VSLVVLLGTDGAGKSSVATALVERLRAGGIPADVRWARWQPFLLRPARAVVARLWLENPNFARGREEPAEVSEVKRAVLGGNGLLGRAYLALACLDYWLQQAPFLLLRRRRGWLLLDRYWYDLLIDACGNAAGAEQTAVRLVLGPWRHLFPRPRHVLFLDVSPQVAFARKQGENSLPYLERRVTTYRAVARALGAERIDADQGLEMVVRDALARVNSTVL
jgi:thymidylate kinase